MRRNPIYYLALTAILVVSSPNGRAQSGGIKRLSRHPSPAIEFGRSTTLRGSFILVTGHFGEHLVESIA